MNGSRTCLRCGEDLRDPSAAYCAVCAAPQLRVTAAELEAAAAEIGQQAPAQSATGQPDWKYGYAACATAASAAGLLSSLLVYPLNGLFLFWALGGAVLTVTLYARRAGRARLSGTVGARLGLVTGCMAAAAMMGFSAFWLALQRFALGNGWKIDNYIAEQFKLLLFQMTQSGNPAQARAAQMFAIPDWRVGMILGTLALLVVMMIFLSTVAGAASGKFLAVRRRAQPLRRL